MKRDWDLQLSWLTWAAGFFLRGMRNHTQLGSLQRLLYHTDTDVCTRPNFPFGVDDWKTSCYILLSLWFITNTPLTVSYATVYWVSSFFRAQLGNFSCLVYFCGYSHLAAQLALVVSWAKCLQQASPELLRWMVGANGAQVEAAGYPEAQPQKLVSHLLFSIGYSGSQGSPVSFSIWRELQRMSDHFLYSNVPDLWFRESIQGLMEQILYQPHSWLL